MSLNKIAKISKLVYICIGKDEDLNEDCAMITFLGIDNYLRTYLYLYGEWQQVSPLTLGLEHLKKIAKYQKFSFFKELKIKEKTQLPCVKPSQWLSYNPPSKILGSILEKNYPGLFGFFNQKE